MTWRNTLLKKLKISFRRYVFNVGILLINMIRWLTNNTFWKAVTMFCVFSILVVGISIFLIYDKALIGPAYIAIAFFGMGTLTVFKIKIKSVFPDIMFGLIDNGFLVFAAAFGGQVAGVGGAVLGGAAGNTLTDGFGGIIEGKMAEKLKHDSYEANRNSFTTMMGKVIGCLLGAGIGLILVWFISAFWKNFVFQ
jgi:hypothetical protein